MIVGRLGFKLLKAKLYTTAATSSISNNGITNRTLSQYLKTMIKLNGPISVYDFMKLSNINPVLGYYNKEGSVFNRQGDFVTSPEISQTFGELVGLWYIKLWFEAGKPNQTKLVELGPGLGTLMEDILRTFKRFPQFYQTIKSINVVEGSESLARKQLNRWIPDNKLELPELLKTLPDKPQPHLGLIDGNICTNKEGIQFNWVSNTDFLPTPNKDNFTILLAHEFFDALPIYRFQKVEDKWREILVDIDQTKEGFQFVVSNSETKASALYMSKNDTIYKNKLAIELAPDVPRIVNKLCEMLQASQMGAGLIVDYGQDYVEGDTLRGIKDHKFCNPLDAPGTVDLSANVNFQQIRACISTSKVTGFGPAFQKDFLLQLGIQQRLQQLLNFKVQEKGASTESLLHFKNQVEQDYHRLTSPDQMGTIYKVLALTTSHTKPTGF